MDLAGYIALAVTAAVLYCLFTDKAKIDFLGFAMMIALVGASEILRLIDPTFDPARDLLGATQALSNFGTPALITIGALFVVSEGLSRTGALEVLARIAMRAARGKPRRVVLGLCLIAGSMSAFLNDTAVVLVLLPVALDLARRTGMPPSKLLIPLCYSALLGGMCTLVGTSTNLLVSEQAVAKGLAPMGMFEMTSVGAPLTLAGIALMAIFSQRFLPARNSLTTTLSAAPLREYVTELTIGPASPLLGKSYQEAFAGVRAQLVFFVRGEAMHWPPYFTERIEPGDTVMLRGTADNIAGLQDALGLRLFNQDRFDPRTMQFFELAVAPGSPMIGRKIRDLNLFRDYGVVTVAVLRGAHHIRERASELPLQAGDLLLVIGDGSAQERVRAASSDFYLLTGIEKNIFLRGLARRAFWIAVGMIVAFSALSLGNLTNLLPFAAILAALGMIGAGCLTARRAYRAIEWPILIFIIGAIGLSQALDNSGVAELAARHLVGALDQFGPVAIIAGLSGFCIVLTAIMSNNAVGVLITPIAILAARELAPQFPGEDPVVLQRAFMLTVAFSASASFATHWGNQVNLMVYGPGGYKPMDYLKAGLPMSLLAWLFVSLGVPLTMGLL
jgi:di/tricarboxylate transporter